MKTSSSGEDHDRDQHAEDQRVAPQGDLPARHHPDQALREAQVPVGLGARGDLVGAVRAVDQTGLIAATAAMSVSAPKTRKKKPPAFARYTGHERGADDVAFGPSGARELGVLVVDDQQECATTSAAMMPGITRMCSE